MERTSPKPANRLPSPEAPGRIVVGVDGSEHSQRALRWGAHLAALIGARLEAISAWQVPPGLGWDLLPDSWEWDFAEPAGKRLIETVDAVFGAHRPPDLETLLVQGGAAQVLLNHARHATMLVVGGRGQGGFAGLLLGSVAGHVTKYASCPVLVVHGDTFPVPTPR